MLSRNIKILAATGAAVILTGGAVGATQLDKAVNLSVDGTATAAHVFGTTVGDLLDSQGISVKPGDVVVPAVDAPLRDGDNVIVKYARTLTLTVDGKTRTVNTTETTVDGALLALGLRGEGARLSVSRSQTIGRQGLALTVVTPKSVTVTVDGKTTTKTITAATVGEALGQLGVTLGKADKVNPPVTTTLTAGTKIAVERFTTKDVKRTGGHRLLDDEEEVRGPLHRPDQGRARRVSPACAPSPSVAPSRTARSSRTKEISSVVTKKPVNAVVLVGTKKRPSHGPDDHDLDERLDLRRRHQPRPRGHVGLDRPVRVGRQLVDQHRQRLLRRPAVPHLDVARPAAVATSPPVPTSPRVRSRSPSPTGSTPRSAPARGAAPDRA